MMHPSPPESRARLLARRLPVDLGITLVLCVVIAVIVTYVVRVESTFSQNLVISLCIGMISLLFVDGGRLLLWGDGKPPRLPFFLLVTIANPVAWYLGSRMAAYLLGVPDHSFDVSRVKNPTSFLIFFALTCAFVTWFFWTRGKLELMKAEAEAEKARAAAVEKQAMQAQLQMLQAQIEPHMLFNTLANLQALIAVDAPRAQRMLDQLIQYLRATLSSSRAEKTTLAQEFSLMQAYLGLMSVRMGARLSYALHLPEELGNAVLPPMLLQPLVENAIKHGIEPKIDGGHVEVRAEREADMLTLTVSDTGLGLDAASHAPGTRVGVANVSERLQMLYGERASFSLLPNAPAGVIARVRLPL